VACIVDPLHQGGLCLLEELLHSLAQGLVDGSECRAKIEHMQVSNLIAIQLAPEQQSLHIPTYHGVAGVFMPLANLRGALCSSVP
jgi:hypothetical protein